MDEQTRKALELAKETLDNLVEMSPTIWAIRAQDKAIAAIDAALSAPAAPVAQPLTEAEAKLLLKKSDLLDMFLHIGWYSAPRKGFDEHGMALIRAIERAHGIGQGGAA